MQFPLRPVSVCCFVLLFFTASAQQPIHVDSSSLLDEVILTAQRSPEKQFRVPYSVSVLGSRELQSVSYRSTPEALAGLPGVFMQKTNHGGGSPFLRGLTGNQTLILVDGIRLNNSTFRYGPNQYLNTIDPFTIRRVEVAKGTGSVQYGTDAMGGVVQVFSRDPEFAAGKPALNGRVLAKYMTGDMEKTGRGEWQYAGKKWALLGGVSLKNFGDLIGGDTTGRQTPSGYNEWSADLKTLMRIGNNTTLVVAGQWLRQNHVPVYHKVQLENFALNEMDPQQRLLGYIRMKTEKGPALFRETAYTFSFQQSDEGRYSRKTGSGLLRKEKDKTRTAGFTADILSVLTKYWTANSGVEVYLDKVYSSRADIQTADGSVTLKRGLYPDRSDYGNFSLYSLQHFRFGKWLLDAGLRYNRFTIQIEDTTLGSVSIHPSALVTNAGLSWNFSRRQAFFISYSSGFRAPNVDDMGTLGIVDFRYEIPVADLRPEKSSHTELGYKVSLPQFSAAASVFYMHIRDLITRIREEGQVINGYPVYRKENTESAFIRGVETEFQYRPVKFLQVEAHMSYTYGQNLTKDEPMRRIPPLNARLRITWRKAGWFAAAETAGAGAQRRLAQGDKEDNRIPSGGTPGWQVFNLYGGMETGRIHLSAGLQNLLNCDYRTHGSGINGAGRSAWLTAAFRF